MVANLRAAVIGSAVWLLVAVGTAAGALAGEVVGGADATDHATLERLTARGPATWPEMRRHWFDTGRSWTTLIATSLTYGFAIQRRPFEVRRARKSPWIEALARTGSPGPT